MSADAGEGGRDAAIAAAFAGRVGAFDLDVAFDVPLRGVTGLFGPSGCGKTTVLRCFAGLQRLDGRLSVGGEVWQDSRAGIFLKPHRRPIGYVFQEASLFAHLSVRGNLVYGAVRSGAGRAGAEFERTVDLLGIRHLLDRAPAALSGGERQRVSVGRALLSRPRLLLMDEPLSALDRASKDEILPYFEALHETLSVPILYVTHDIAELERLADTLVLMDRGRVTASGSLAGLQADPALPLVRGPEAAVTLETRIVGYDEQYRLTSVAVGDDILVVPGRRGEKGRRQRVRITASDVSFTLSPAADTSILNVLPARIRALSEHDGQGAQLNVIAALGAEGNGPDIVGRITRKSQERLGLVPGTLVQAQIKSVALI